MNLSSDFVLPFQLEKAPIRGRFTRLKDSLREILEQHKYPPLVNRLLGELVAITTALANLFKFDGIFTLQISGDGPIRLMVVDITHKGDVRACVRFDEEKVLKLPTSTTSIHHLLGVGYLAFTIDQNNADDRYQGIVELSGSTLAQCLHHFFRQSDQLETGLVVFSQADRLTTSDHLAAVLIIQRMPSSSQLSYENLEIENDVWLQALSSLGTATAQELLSADLAPEDVLFRLFWEEDIRVFEKHPFIAKCRCSKERILDMLKTFSASDIEEMTEEGKIIVTCEFCNQSYNFDPQNLES